MKKKCLKCQDTKELEEFHCDKTMRDGRTRWCKACDNASTKKWRKENPEKAKTRYKAWWEKNSKKYAAKRKATGLVYKFGITFDEYNEMLAAQKNGCAICGEALGNDGHQPCVDHDHSKKGRESVRGIVHRKCNLYLGYIEKNPGLFGKIYQYLERHSTER